MKKNSKEWWRAFGLATLLLVLGDIAFYFSYKYSFLICVFVIFMIGAWFMYNKSYQISKKDKK